MAILQVIQTLKIVKQLGESLGSKCPDHFQTFHEGMIGALNDVSWPLL